jgi:hypothetical protein
VDIAERTAAPRSAGIAGAAPTTSAQAWPAGDPQAGRVDPGHVGVTSSTVGLRRSRPTIAGPASSAAPLPDDRERLAADDGCQQRGRSTTRCADARVRGWMDRVGSSGARVARWACH